MTPYYASMTRRWHTNEHLRDSGDDLAAHGGRMAIMALMFWPGECDDLIKDCVTHDLGEYVTGDIPWGAPNKDHGGEIGALIDMGMCYITRDPRLKLLDVLDAYLWARHHKPDLMDREDWQGQRKKILAMCDELGVYLDVHGMEI